MSSIKLSPNASGTGEFTIAAPNSNSNYTLTLPTTTGTVQVSGAPISGTTGTFSGLIFANGGGVQFPAVQIPSSDPNCLDDYEEGTWTPTFSASGSAPTVTYQGQSGSYVKIGRFVWVYFEINALTFSGGSGTLRVAGLPFASANSGGLSVSYEQGFNTHGPIAGLVNAPAAINLTMKDSNTAISYLPVGYANSNAYVLGFANFIV